jgi:toxin ParE1/3/4
VSAAQVRFGPEASAELRDVTRWYEDRRAGLGVAFLAAVDVGVEAIQRWPSSGAVVPGLPEDLVVRRAPVARYPYHLVYMVDGDAVHVLAVAHDRQRPAYWTDRADR